MQFPNQIVTEITAPNNVTFAPGNVVTGFGSQVPAELISAGYPNAIVFYSNDWNPAATTPTPKFKFIGAGSSTSPIGTGGADSLDIGYGVVLNPSVDQTAIVKVALRTGLQISGSNFISNVEIWNALNSTSAQFTSFFGSNDPSFQLDDANGVKRMSLFHKLATGIASIAVGNGWQLNCGNTDTSPTVTGPINKDSAWQPFTLFNGWFGNAAPDAPLYRMMNDGTVQFCGMLNKASAPTNGEQWGSVAAGYLPLKQHMVHACSNLTTDGNQKILIDATGKCFIYDPAAGNGSMFIGGMRYPSTLIP